MQETTTADNITTERKINNQPSEGEVCFMLDYRGGGVDATIRFVLECTDPNAVDKTFSDGRIGSGSSPNADCVRIELQEHTSIKYYKFFDSEGEWGTGEIIGVEAPNVLPTLVPPALPQLYGCNVVATSTSVYQGTKNEGEFEDLKLLQEEGRLDVGLAKKINRYLVYTNSGLFSGQLSASALQKQFEVGDTAIAIYEMRLQAARPENATAYNTPETVNYKCIVIPQINARTGAHFEKDPEVKSPGGFNVTGGPEGNFSYEIYTNNTRLTSLSATGIVAEGEFEVKKVDDLVIPEYIPNSDDSHKIMGSGIFAAPLYNFMNNDPTADIMNFAMLKVGSAHTSVTAYHLGKPGSSSI